MPIGEMRIKAKLKPRIFLKVENSNFSFSDFIKTNPTRGTNSKRIVGFFTLNKS